MPTVCVIIEQMSLTTKIQYLPSVGPKTAAKLNKLGIETINDLFFYFPRRYEDYTSVVSIDELAREISANSSYFAKGSVFTIRGTILGLANKKTRRRGFTVTEGVVTDETGSIKVVWFNQPYLVKMLKPGSEMILSGKVVYDRFSNSLVMESPTRANRPKIVPIYGETAGISSFFIAKLFQKIKADLAEIKEYLPSQFVGGKRQIAAREGVENSKDHGPAFPEVEPSAQSNSNSSSSYMDDNDSEIPKQLSKLDLMPLTDAIANLHEPKNSEVLKAAQRRLGFDELFLISLRSNLTNMEMKKAEAKPILLEVDLLKKFIDSLPFALTSDQKKAVWQIVQDMARPVPMNRLLNGDVGSGKTIVAAIAAYLAVKAGFRVLLMCPTSILAVQHFETFKDIFEEMKISIGLITSDRVDNYQLSVVTEPSKGNLKNTKLNRKNLITENCDITIGTQALIQKDVNFNNLGLVIVDEQHRFGVAQRAKLAEMTSHQQSTSDHLLSAQIPHFLSMTATPIPRTLQLALFGDLDVSLIKEKPANRKEIKTRLVEQFNRQKAYDFIRNQIRVGRQAFIICPLIEEKQGPEAGNGEETDQKSTTLTFNLFDEEKKTVKKEYEKLQKIFPEFEIAMLHGKMKAAEKDVIMAKFAGGDSKILVSTSVVEVGVDVPNASVMMIEDADRFGLAQIHQFRGRVGRAEHQSFCFLFSNTQSEKALKRLRSLEKISDGFELAQVDLETRGPGAILGMEQSGLLDLKMASLSDQISIADAAAAAKAIAPELKKYPLLEAKISNFMVSKHME